MIDQPSDFGGLSFCRVVVVGANGAGKTWFARQLSDRMGASVICKDALALKTGWVQRARAEVRADIVDRISAERWVLEGGPSVLIPEVLARADLVIWLDMSAGLRFWRIIRRSLRYAGRVRPEHPPGNRDWPGLRQWRFAWRALTGGDRFRGAIEAGLDGVVTPVVRLRTRVEVVDWLNAHPGG